MVTTIIFLYIFITCYSKQYVPRTKFSSNIEFAPREEWEEAEENSNKWITQSVYHYQEQDIDAIIKHVSYFPEGIELFLGDIIFTTTLPLIFGATYEDLPELLQAKLVINNINEDPYIMSKFIPNAITLEELNDKVRAGMNSSKYITPDTGIDIFVESLSTIFLIDVILGNPDRFSVGKNLRINMGNLMIMDRKYTKDQSVMIIPIDNNNLFKFIDEDNSMKRKLAQKKYQNGINIKEKPLIQICQEFVDKHIDFIEPDFGTKSMNDQDQIRQRVLRTMLSYLEQKGVYIIFILERILQRSDALIQNIEYNTYQYDADSKELIRLQNVDYIQNLGGVIDDILKPNLKIMRNKLRIHFLKQDKSLLFNPRRKKSTL